MAKGASESGQVESYICSKIKRNPWASKPCAQYLGYFTAGACPVRLQAEGTCGALPRWNLLLTHGQNRHHSTKQVLPRHVGA